MKFKKPLFSAAWSFSETPFKLRESMKIIFSCFDTMFFAYQSSFEEIDKIKYFNRIEDIQESIKLKTGEIKSLATHFYKVVKIFRIKRALYEV